jgi:hypothetical protein
MASAALSHLLHCHVHTACRGSQLVQCSQPKQALVRFSIKQQDAVTASGAATASISSHHKQALVPAVTENSR